MDTRTLEAADHYAGINSKASKVVGDTAEGPQPTGYAAYRATVKSDAMRNDPDTAWLIEKPNINMWIGDHKRAMTYMISGGKTFNMVLAHKDAPDPSLWTSNSARRDMEDHYDGWDLRLRKVLSKVDNLQKWPLMMGAAQNERVARSNKLLILGNAAHAMLPFMSQGAAMAVEDAAALATALQDVRSHSDLVRVLRVFEEVRRERTRPMQQASSLNAQLLHFADGPEQQARDAAMEAEVLGLHFETSSNQWSHSLTQQ
ncbi:hypothetical protein MBLNU13_g00854t1 [Cladosporium sp. NU13]